MTKSISIQMHCLPEELIELINASIPVSGLHFTFVAKPPAKNRIIHSPAELKGIAISKWEELLITQYTPTLQGLSAYEFLTHNPNALVVSFAPQQNGALEESWVSTRCKDLESFAIWQKIARKIKSKLRIGGKVLNRANGMQGQAKNHYYSAGALDFARNGGTLFMLGNQTNEFLPHELESSLP
jgi:hypothetical protein